MTDLNDIPKDFPNAPTVAAIAGAHPKVLATKVGGSYYALGCSPQEHHARWQMCEDLAHQFAAKCRESKAGKRAHLTEVEILDQYLTRLLKTRWGTDAELKWVIRRTASMLCWPVPALAKENHFGN